jgi:phage terminase large subunit
LESERARDERLLSRPEYEWKWLGGYNDKVENAIILPEWFDACVDAHKNTKFEWRIAGQEKVAFDPSDVGEDPEALAYMHGNVVLQAMSNDQKAIDDACDWATDFANRVKADVFIWDCDGMGIGLKRQVQHAFNGKKITTDQFKGSEGPLFPKEIFEPLEGEQAKPKTNKDTFRNQRAQWYFWLARRMKLTYAAVEKGKYINPDELISFSSDILHLDLLRAELCSVPRRLSGDGRLQLLTKKEMLDQEIASPNIGDCIMMLQKPIDTYEEPVVLDCGGW